MRRPTISFSVDPEQLEEINQYAKIKGFGRPSNLARKALFAYMGRLPLSDKQRENAVLHCSEKGNKNEGCDHESKGAQ